MQAHKISISIPKKLYDFLEDYQEEHHLKSRSEVITAALHLLQQTQLEAEYLAANKEIDDAFDITSGDGLKDETW